MAGAGGEKRFDPASLEISIEPFNRGHRPSGHTSGGSDACHAGSAINPDGAASALALGAAPVLDRTAPQLLPERVKERDSLIVINLDRVPVKEKGNGWRRARFSQLNEEPQPQVRVAFGFTIWNPAPCSPSL